MRTRRRHTGVQLATALTLASLAPSDARAGQSFIQTYIDAQGGCASAAGPLAFVLAGGGLQAPFGKLAGDWTDTDLAALPAILSACERTAARVNPYLAAEVRGQARELETRAPSGRGRGPNSRPGGTSRRRGSRRHAGRRTCPPPAPRTTSDAWRRRPDARKRRRGPRLGTVIVPCVKRPNNDRRPRCLHVR